MTNCSKKRKNAILETFITAYKAKQISIHKNKNEKR